MDFKRNIHGKALRATRVFKKKKYLEILLEKPLVKYLEKKNWNTYSKIPEENSFDKILVGFS